MELIKTTLRALALLFAVAAACLAQSAGITNVTVSFSATPTFTMSGGITHFDMTMTGNSTSSTFSGAAVGSGSFKICQDATGGRTLVWPTNAFGFGTIDPTASKCSRQAFKYDGTNIQAIGPMSTDGSATGGVVGLGTAATLPFVTTVGSPGVNTNIPTEKAVRDAISAGGGATMGSVTITGTANQITVTGTCTGTTSISCTLSLPSGLQLPGTINKLTFTQPATGATITVLDGKVLTVNKTLTFDGSDGVTITFPSSSATVATLGLTNTFTGRQDAKGAASTAPAKTGTSLPGTCVVGDLYFKSDATAGQNLYECQSTNTWTQQLNSGGGAVSAFTGSTASTSSFSATPTFSLADVSVKSPTRFEPGALTGNVTSVTFTNKTAGAKFSIAWLQDGTGGRTVAYGASASSTCTISPTASKTTTQQFEVAADGSTVIGTTCTTDDTPNLVIPETGSPVAGVAGSAVLTASSSTHRLEMNNNSGGRVQVVGAGGDINTSDQVTNGSHLTSGSTVVAQKFFGTAAPGSVAGNLPGDQFTDTTNHHQYVCNAPSGTAAPACTSVATAGWLQVDSASTGGLTKFATYSASTSVTNTTTETDLLSLTITANTLGANSILHAVASGYEQHLISTGGDLTLKVYWNATLLGYILWAPQAFANANRDWTLQFDIYSTAAASGSTAVDIHGFLVGGTKDPSYMQGGALETSAVSPGTGLFSIPTNASGTLKVTATWGSASTSNAINQTNFYAVVY